MQSFLDALTRGGPDGFPRPIELHAHDPTRYIGDMLAWVHQATAGENEFLDGLFDVNKGKRRMVGQAREFGNANPDLAQEGVEVDPEEVEQRARVDLSRSCLDKNLEGLSRPLKVSQSAVFRSRRYPLTGDAIFASSDPDTRHCQFARGRHYGLQDCKPCTVLPRDDAKNDRRGGNPYSNSC